MGLLGWALAWERVLVGEIVDVDAYAVCLMDEAMGFWEMGVGLAF